MTDHYETRCLSCGGSDEQGCYADCPTNLIPKLEKQIADLKTWGTPDYPRICLNCGITWPADKPRTTQMCGEPGDEYSACLTDFTYMECIEEIKKLQGQVRSLNRALNDLRKEKADDAAATPKV